MIVFTLSIAFSKPSYKESGKPKTESVDLIQNDSLACSVSEVSFESVEFSTCHGIFKSFSECETPKFEIEAISLKGLKFPSSEQDKELIANLNTKERLLKHSFKYTLLNYRVPLKPNKNKNILVCSEIIYTFIC